MSTALLYNISEDDFHSCFVVASEVYSERLALAVACNRIAKKKEAWRWCAAYCELTSAQHDLPPITRGVGFAEYDDETTRAIALGCARGSGQREVLLGVKPISHRNRLSRTNQAMLRRMQSIGLVFQVNGHYLTVQRGTARLEE